jgi:putative transposase
VIQNWPHSPAHCLDIAGAYIVTASTYQKLAIFDSPGRLSYLHSHLLASAKEHAAALQAWAVFPNHYHFIAQFSDPQNLRTLIRQLHSITAREINRRDNNPGRKVWFQYWESHLSFEKSYFARLRYVHENAVHHRIVRNATNYPWCSAAWFQANATPSFRKTILSFQVDRLVLPDDFMVTINGFPGD